ncbi:hypothetical protein MTO96_027423 [Rhipicephalus appendiculatus]
MESGLKEEAAAEPIVVSVIGDHEKLDKPGTVLNEPSGVSKVYYHKCLRQRQRDDFNKVKRRGGNVGQKLRLNANVASNQYGQVVVHANKLDTKNIRKTTPDLREKARDLA